MNIHISDEALQGIRLSEEDVRRDLAIGLFVDRRMTLGQAACMAGISQDEFLRLLSEKEIPIHYDVEDFEADIRTLKEIGQL